MPGVGSGGRMGGGSGRLLGVPNSGAWAYAVHALLASGPAGPRRRDCAGIAADCGMAELDLARGLGGALREPLICVRRDEEDLEDVADALRALAPLFPETELGEPAFFGEDGEERLASIERLHLGARVVLATAASLELACSTPGEYAQSRLAVRGGVGRKELLGRLEALGYRRVDFAESPGEYAVRGAVVDFYPPQPRRAVRVVYEGDAARALKSYDPETQEGKPGFLDEAILVPMREGSGQRLGAVLAGMGTWLIEEGLEVHAAGERCVRFERAISRVAGASDGFADLGASSRFPLGAGIAALAASCLEWRRRGLKVLLFAMNRGEDERIQEMLVEKVPEGQIQFLVGPLRHGFESESAGLALVSSAEIFGRSYRPRRGWLPAAAGRTRARWGELKKGDFVVHDLYGIGRYLGLETVQTRDDAQALSGPPPRADGTRRLGKDVSDEPSRRVAGAMDCLRLEFRGNDTLFVPMTEFKSVQKYVGAEGHRPRLSSLDTRSWSEVRERVSEGIRELAEELLKVQAARKAAPGRAFEPDSRMETEFAESFPFEETPDQRRAIDAVKADMMEPCPMDRVIVGDVGYGKTEVAMRAALKCAGAGAQTAVLVPTTILADQHARTFRGRFAEYPVRVELLSRFQTKAEQRKIIADAAAGTVDILVGTHRLLQPDVAFKDLGLLVIDEEHRFGVAAKERMKALRRDVDCLTLSATPIPRTLNQCLSGLRAVSLIQSAPIGRQSIHTIVRPYDERHVADSIRAELAREGQVFYVHNRVKGLPKTVSGLEALLPGVRFVTAHGQMRSEELEKAMWDFFNRKYDVLVASSIIESGLDIPSVNTLLIQDAQDFGLSQLYQLRGRIGRERRRAYCCLYHPAGAELAGLPDDARKRLEAMRDFATLGSGLTLAMRDLEIRGAGDLLGARQHGFLNAVGVEFYTELLQEEIERLKGRKRGASPPPRAQLDIALPAFLPQDYLPGDLERIQFYKRILAADDAGTQELRRELSDLCGPLPPEVENLLRVARIARRATSARIRTIAQRGLRVEVYFHAEAPVPVETITRWTSAYEDRIEFVRSSEGDGLRVWITGREPIAWIEDFLEGLK